MAVFESFPHSRTLYKHIREKLERHFGHRPMANNFHLESIHRNGDFGRFPHSRTLYRHGREKFDRHLWSSTDCQQLSRRKYKQNLDFWTFPTLTACTVKIRAPFGSSTDCQQLSHRKYVQKWRFFDVSHTHVRCIGMDGKTWIAILVFDRLPTTFP